MFDNYNLYSAIIDIVALIIIIGFTIHGAKNGFVKTFFSSFGSIIALLLAVLLCSSVANFLEKTYGFTTTVSNWLNNFLNKTFGSDIMNTTLEDASTNGLKENGIAAWLINLILSVKNDGSIPMDVTLNQVICPVFAYYTVCIISAIGLYIVFRLIFLVLGVIVNKAHSIFLVALVDKNLGLLLGIVRGIFYVQFLVLVLSVIPLDFVQIISLNVDNSILTKFINSFNIYRIIVGLFASSNLTENIKNLISA